MKEGKDYEDLQLQHRQLKTKDGEVCCGEVLPDGSVCSFSGTPAVVGKHRLDAHGCFNKIKAASESTMKRRLILL